MPLFNNKFFFQGIPQTHQDASFNLAFDLLRVDGHPHIVGRDDLEDLDLS